MTQNYTGMRKGISLVEMIIAIILFATLAVISLKYTKQYLNTDIQAKKARIAAVTNQATQLTQAYDIYVAEKGIAPAAIGDLNGSSAIMSAIPTVPTEVGAAWTLNTATGITAYPNAFELLITTSTTNSDEQYCALFNREFNSSVDLNVTEGNLIYDAATTALAYTASGNKKAFCHSNATNIFKIVVLVP
ncbi:MAG: hypothetical protein WC680_05680 [Sulfuricurvum sp.]|jgi:type II secretory pathway pseudopilin PulG